MLISLRIKNMALIGEEEIELSDGLNILTGETGAGKSIMIGSVNVALGTGHFRDYMAEGTDYSLVELTFVTDREDILHKLSERDIPYEDGQIIITRKFQKGRTVSRVNGESVPGSFIRELAEGLIDIHGQHEHQSLLYPRYHLQLLDRWCGPKLSGLLDECAQSCRQHRRAVEELEKAQGQVADRERQMDLLRYEIEEIDEAALMSGEDEKLETEYTRMSHQGRIMTALDEVYRSLSADGGAYDAISSAAGSLHQIEDLDEPLPELAQQASVAEDMVSELARSIRSYMDDFVYDEEEFARITDRLDLINRLKGKYAPLGAGIDEVLRYRDQRQEELDVLTDLEAHIERLKKEADTSRKRLDECAAQISAVRREEAKGLQEEIRQALLDLNFEQVRFEIHFNQKERAGENGWDEVCFMISLNPGMPLRPLQEVASGGELSRIMLAIKAVMAGQDETGTLIFDEIDTGISGRTAQKVSEKMAVIARRHQVICITHLAQIAAMADAHFLITKESDGAGTHTHVRALDEEGSVRELARIIGGVSITRSVEESAAEMKKMAQALKAEMAE